MQELTGKVAVITGGASGIGLALAKRFAAEGMKLVLADVEVDPLERVAEELQAGGAQVLAVQTDVSDAAQVEHLAARSYERFQAVHVLCNNAGVGSGGLSWEVPVDEWKWVLGVNLHGVIHGIRAFVPRMLKGGDEGHIVNTASMAGLVSAPYLGAYNVSKHGVVTLSETMHHELNLIGSKLRVSVLCPGFVQTRIADSDRNRPADLTPQPAAAGGLSQLMGAAVAGGIEADVVGERVVEAIREGRLHILTHPELGEHITTRWCIASSIRPGSCSWMKPVSCSLGRNINT